MEANKNKHFFLPYQALDERFGKELIEIPAHTAAFFDNQNTEWKPHYIFLVAPYFGEWYTSVQLKHSFEQGEDVHNDGIYSIRGP